MEEYLDVLAGSPLFDGVEREEIGAMLECIDPTVREYPKGAYLHHFGERITSVGLVLAGGVHIVKEDYWGNRNLLSELCAGQLFGEAYACANGEPLSVSVVAAQACTVLFLDVGPVLTLCPSACPYHARLVRNLIAVLADKNIRLTNKIEHMSQRRLRDKVLSYLSDQSRRQGGAYFTIPFRRQQLADYLSVDRSALSAVLCQLRDEGILEFERNRFRLLEP